GSHDRRPHVVGDGGKERQLEEADLAARGALHDGDGSVGPGEDGARLRQEGSSHIGEAGPTGIAVEQAYAEIAFECADLLRQRLLGEVQVLRGTAETEVLGDGDKVPELTQVHGHRFRL
ncbi:MAG: hypothetical protein QOE61_2235, partial [Micromonosporaceae bacterium]|nr:hypothetical protein [Micromonosporaceae bacterium]